MDKLRTIEFTALWSGYINGNSVSCVTKFNMTLDPLIDRNTLAMAYLKNCACVLGITDFFVKEICYDVR